jgi:glucan biosynthesis protein C
MNTLKRIYFLDHLRSFIIFLVVFYHVLMAYILYPVIPMYLQDVFIHNINGYPSAGYMLFFAVILLIFNAPTMMSIMFFIAGYFALAPLIKKGTKHFLKDKIIRLGIPFLLGVTVLAALSRFMAYRSQGNRTNYFNYWFSEFFRPQNFTQYHFWFLGVLLLFFSILCLAYLIFRDKISSVETKAGKLSPSFIFFFITLTTGLYFAVNLFYSADSFTSLYILQFQTVVFPIYLAYFIFGIFAYKKDWFKDGYKPKILPWTITYIISIMIYIPTLIYVYQNLSARNIVFLKLINDIANNLSIFSALFMLLAFFQKYLNGDQSYLKKISRGSYSTYLIHFSVVCIVAYVSINISLPLLLKFLTQIIICTLLSWEIGYLLTRIPIVRKAL